MQRAKEREGTLNNRVCDGLTLWITEGGYKVEQQSTST
jgi:hypothetical protein